MKRNGFSGAKKLFDTPVESTEPFVADDNQAISRPPIDQSPSGETGLSIVDDIDAKLGQLINALRGDSRSQPYDATPEAYIGIVAFSEYWGALADRQKSAMFIQIPELKDLLERLFRPAHVNYTECIFSTELIGAQLERICQKYNIIQTPNETPSDGLELRR